MTSATETLSASAANFVEAQLLNIPQGIPMLISKRVTNIGDTCFEYGINRLVGSRYKYTVHMSGR
ncbi:MAG: UTRA domain-containing protein [Oscillospiraceae bacterium]